MTENGDVSIFPESGDRKIETSPFFSKRSRRKNRNVPIFLGFTLCFLAPTVWAESPGEARFFAECPRRALIHLHDERRPWDPHAMLYMALGITELEVLRVADWAVDLSLLGYRADPFQRTTRAVRAGFNRLPRWTPIERAGEFVNALQLPELSFGDATATHPVTAGGVRGPGSGMVVRINKLIDWGQRVTGDVNRLAGAPIGRPQGLIAWPSPGRAVDGAQWLLVKAFNSASVFAARVLDGSLTGAEVLAEEVVNAGYQRPHQEETVFLRLPMEVYRVHELWFLEHRPSLVIGAQQEFARATHEALAHHRRPATPQDWVQVDRLSHRVSEIVVMLPARLMARAPAPLKPYVVPAAWILSDDTTEKY